METITDLANQALQCRDPSTPHHLEAMAGTTSSSIGPATIELTMPPLEWVDVFVDDHIALAQGSPVQLNHV